jgi:hypothetical protein
VEARQGLILFALCAAWAHGARITICPVPTGAEGVSLQRDFFSADGEPLKLLLSEHEISGAGCAAIPLPVPAGDVLWMEPAPPEFQGRLPGRITLQGDFTPGRARVSEIIPHGPGASGAAAPAAPAADPAPAKPRTIQDKAGVARLRPARSAGRSAWIWSPEAWRDTPERLWALRASEGVKTLFLTIPVAEGGEVESPDAVRAFVAASRRRGVAVWAVVGDPRDVLPESAPALRRRLRAYAFYNRHAAPEARLAGAQLDIEPYLLPGFALSPGHWRVRYVETILAARDAAEGLDLDVVMPVWWATHPAFGTRVLDPLDLPGVSLTVMNYRTRPEALRAGAEPFLDWGARKGRPVRIALEIGNLGDEARRLYEAAPTGEGELWLLPGPRGPVFVLLRAPRAGLEGRAFRFVSEGVFAASNLTFAGDAARLRAVAETMDREWRARPAFAGIALHGLEDVYFPK